MLLTAQAGMGQSFGGYSILKVLILIIVLVTGWYILNQVVTLTPRMQAIAGALGLAIVGIIALVILFSFL